MKTGLGQIKGILFQIRLKVDFDNLHEEGIDNSILEPAVTRIITAIEQLSVDQIKRIGKILDE